MAHLYVTEQGSMLRKVGERVIVSKNDDELLEVPCHQLEAVLLFGNVHFTTPAVRKLFEHNVELALLTQRGKLLCQLTPPMPKNVELRMAQYDRHRDGAFALAVARAIVMAKLHNSYEVVRAYAANHPEANLGPGMAELQRGLSQAEGAVSVEALMGVEGASAKVYFAALANLLPPELEFGGRNKRPPKDPVNALLSLGYTLLANEIASLADALGLDPHVGFLHRLDYGRPSLAADLVEELRAPVIDRLVLRLFNRRQLTSADFFLHAPSGGMHLTTSGLKKFLAEYDAVMGQPPPVAMDDERSDGASVRQRLRVQLRSLATAIETGGAYAPTWL